MHTMTTRPIVFFKRFNRRRGFQDLFNQYIYFLFKTLWILQNRSIRNLCEIFLIIDRGSLDDFYEYKMSMGLYNGKNPVVQL